MDKAYHDALVVLALAAKLYSYHSDDDGTFCEADLDTLFVIIEQKREEFYAVHNCTASAFLHNYHNQ